MRRSRAERKYPVESIIDVLGIDKRVTVKKFLPSRTPRGCNLHTIAVTFYIYVASAFSRLSPSRSRSGTRWDSTTSCKINPRLSRWAISAEWHARQCIDAPLATYPFPRALLNRSCLHALSQWTAVAGIVAHSSGETRYNCVWRLPVGRALTKSINLECSAVFLLEKPAARATPVCN